MDDNISVPVTEAPEDVKVAIQRIEFNIAELLAQMKQDQTEIDKLNIESSAILADIQELGVETRSKLAELKAVI